LCYKNTKFSNSTTQPPSKLLLVRKPAVQAPYGAHGAQRLFAEAFNQLINSYMQFYLLSPCAPSSFWEPLLGTAAMRKSRTLTP